MVKDKYDFALDDMLGRWHSWRKGYQHAQGYSSSDATGRDYQTPTHWDWLNGAEDDRAEKEQMKAFDQVVDTVPNQPQPWQLALQFEARNIATGNEVWFSPRMPENRKDRDGLILEARNMLMLRLVKAGLMS